MKFIMWQVFKILNIYKKVKEIKVPVKTAYKFNKLCLELENSANFYNEELNKIIQQYADRDENGSIKNSPDGGIQIKEDQIAVAQKEIDTLWNLEIEKPSIRFAIDELDGLNLSIEDFNSMLPFIEEE